MIRRVTKRIARHPAVRWARGRAYEREFLTGRGGRFFGAFSSLDDAQRWDPSTSNAAYDDASLVDMNLDGFLEIQLFDWPVIFFLREAIGSNGLRSLTDFGGHIGVKYYAYAPHVSLPPDFRWQVVELDAMVRAGEETRNGRTAPHLSFHRELGEARSALLLCSGSLQYVELAPNEIVERAGEPETLVLNKVPLTDGDDFWTLENFSGRRIPYRVFDAEAFRLSLRDRGYELEASWRIRERDFAVPFRDRAAQMFGMVWRRRG